MNKKSDNLLPVEQALAAGLETHRPGDCPAPDRLIELAERGRRLRDHDTLMRHVATCADCYALFRSLRAAEIARHESGERAAAPGFRTWFRRPGWTLLAPAIGLAGVALVAFLLRQRPEPTHMAGLPPHPEITAPMPGRPDAGPQVASRPNPPIAKPGTQPGKPQQVA